MFDFSDLINSLSADSARISEFADGMKESVRFLFDADYYLATNPDLVEYDGDLFDHFWSHGWKEERDPSKNFDTSEYLNLFDELRSGNINPLVHFLAHGRFVLDTGLISRSSSKVADLEIETPIAESDVALCAAYFDKDFYLSTYPDLQNSSIDLLHHYLRSGWRELRNPASNFSTDYYLSSNPDIAVSGVNPFIHFIKAGRHEGRYALPFMERKRTEVFEPLVSVVIPNYNHANYLHERIESILSQSYQNFEIILLDDCSSDESHEILQSYALSYPDKIKFYPNTSNSGNVFKQWQKGLSLAKGELFWICESDDFCENDLLSGLVRHFVDPSVMIAFGNIQFADVEGKEIAGLTNYREGAEPDIWNNVLHRSANRWFNGAFAIRNVIPNVGGCVIRNQKIGDDIWEIARSFRISGDWFLYIILAAGGRIVYDPEVKAYFRQHGKNTSVVGASKREYYEEHEYILKVLRDQWGTSDQAVARYYSLVSEQYQFVGGRKLGFDLADCFHIAEVISTKKSATHILMCFLGFSLGGGEIFPIRLANALVERGYIVSAMTVNNSEDDPRVRAMLDKRIAVYESQLIEEIGVETFCSELGIDLIHSHSIAVELFFFSKHNFKPELPYVITLHGSYECIPIGDETLSKVLRACGRWIYLSEKNLGHLRGYPMDPRVLTQIENGANVDPEPFPLSRSDLGIEEDAVVFTVVSRAIYAKGWHCAIEAALGVSKRSKTKIYLLLCGTGEQLEVLRARYGDNSNIKFLGFQSKISGLYRISDCAILPTRFAGESYPLSLIEALQVGIPVISSRVGEIPKMIESKDGVAGILVEPESDDVKFAIQIGIAMLKMSDSGIRTEFRKIAAKAGGRFDMSVVTDNYIAVYDAVRDHLSAP